MPIDVKAVKGTDVFKRDIKKAPDGFLLAPGGPEIRVIGIESVHQVCRADQEIKGTALFGVLSYPGMQKVSQMRLNAQLCPEADFDLLPVLLLQLPDFRKISRHVKLHADFRVRIVGVIVFRKTQKGKPPADSGANHAFGRRLAVAGKG